MSPETTSRTRRALVEQRYAESRGMMLRFVLGACVLSVVLSVAVVLFVVTHVGVSR